VGVVDEPVEDGVGDGRVWDSATGHLIAILSGHDAQVYSAAFSPDGTRVVTASADHTARLWDTATGEPIVVLIGHDGEVYSAAFSPNGTSIVTASFDGTARLWDIKNVPKGNIFAVACAWLPNHDLQGFARVYGLENIETICAGDPPLPNWSGP
jgi:WD40 repeat protein